MSEVVLPAQEGIEVIGDQQDLWGVGEEETVRSSEVPPLNIGSLRSEAGVGETLPRDPHLRTYT